MKTTYSVILFAFVFSSFFLITSCRKDLVEETQMVGKWECVKIETKGENPPLKSIIFDFKADSTYHYYSVNNLKGQRGVWYTLDDILYTTPEGGKKMGVKLGVSGMDTLRFYQNRGGKPETWTMVRR